MKLKSSLALVCASIIMDSALAHGRSENLLPLTVAILDAVVKRSQVKANSD